MIPETISLLRELIEAQSNLSALKYMIAANPSLVGWYHPEEETIEERTTRYQRKADEAAARFFTAIGGAK